MTVDAARPGSGRARARAAEDTDGASDAPVTIRNAVSGGDYGAVRADSVVVTILENDTSALSTVDGSAPESGAEMTFAVTISVAGTADVTVDYATSDGTARAGSDYTAMSGTLTFPQGSTSSLSIRVPVLDDVDDEAEEETFRLTLSNVRDGVLAGGSSTLRVTVDYATSDGTARAGSDGDVGDATFPQGSTSSLSIRVPVLDDVDDEAEEETFRLTLSNVRNGVLAGARRCG